MNIIPNTRIPPRLRFCCGADSPQRGEYRPLCRPSGRDSVVPKCNNNNQCNHHVKTVLWVFNIQTLRLEPIAITE